MTKKRFLAGLVAVSTIAVFVVGFVAFSPNKISAFTDLSDTMTRLEVSVDSQHSITFTPQVAVDDDTGIEIVIPVALTEFDDTALGVADYSITQAAGGTACSTWTEVAYVVGSGTIQFECTDALAAGTGAITVNIIQDLTNPSVAGNYTITPKSYVLNGDGFGGGNDVEQESNDIAVDILSNDQIDVYATVDPYITFIVTTLDDNSYIDLGSLPYSQGVNSIDYDGDHIVVSLSTNAYNGAAVTVRGSEGAGLYSANTNAIIPAEDTGEAILDEGLNDFGAGDRGFGVYDYYNGGTSASTSVGTFQFTADYSGSAYDSGSDDYFTGPLSATPTEILNSDGSPVVDGSAQITVSAVAARNTPAADDYTETLTFVATGLY